MPQPKRKFWLYVWEATLPSGKTLYYVGRASDKAPSKALSPFGRAGQFPEYAEDRKTLRRYLSDKHSVKPESCSFRLVARQVILEGAAEAACDSKKQEIADAVAAEVKEFLGSMAAAAYEVANDVKSPVRFDKALLDKMIRAFVPDFPGLRPWL